MAIRIIARIIRPFLKVLDYITPLADLLARAWVANVFFRAGLVKIQTWPSTVILFTHEYHVPLLSPYVAALIGTWAELILPILLLVGFGGRIMIFIFFVYNAVAVISYPYLWTPDGAVGLTHHIYWGLLLLMLMCHGPGKWSVDYWIRKKLGHHLDY